MCGSSLAIVLFYYMLYTNNLFLASLISAFNSLLLIPFVPIMLELSCQLVLVVGEGSAVGLLFAMGNLSGFIYNRFHLSNFHEKIKEQVNQINNLLIKESSIFSGETGQKKQLIVEKTYDINYYPPKNQ